MNYQRLKLIEIVLITPVTNKCLERGDSAIKRVETRHRTQTTCLNSLLTITLTGPDFESREYEEVMNKLQIHTKTEILKITY